MSMNAPCPEAGNSPQGILEPPEPVAVDVPLVPVVAPVPDTTAPGIYTNGVLTANVVDGAIVALDATPETTVTP